MLQDNSLTNYAIQHKVFGNNKKAYTQDISHKDVTTKMHILRWMLAKLLGQIENKRISRNSYKG